MSDTASAVASYLQTRQPEEAVRASLSLASGSNPDAEAEFARLSREAGIPIDSVRENKDAVQQRLAMPDPVELAKKFPSTTKYLSKLDNARVAHDDVGTLTAIEQAVRGFIDPSRTRTSPKLPKVVNSAQFAAEVKELMALSPGLDADTARTVLMGAMTVDDVSPLIGQSRGPKPTIGNIFRGAFNTDQFRQADAGAGVAISDMLGFDSANAVRAYERAKARVDVRTPEFETATGRGLYGGLTSTVRNAPGIALSVASGSAIPGLAVAGVTTAADAYGKYRARGATPAEAGVGAAVEGAVEVGTELLPMSFLVKKLGKAGAGDFIKGLLAREVPGEQLATLAQDAVDTAIANPDKTWEEFARERPGAAYQTLLATLVQTGVMGAANKVVGKVAGFDATVERAEMTAAAAEKLVGLADASKLRQRDPQAFQQFIAEVAGEGDAPSEFYIDAEQLANSLNQSAITIEQLRAFAPAVAQQLEASKFVPGADIRVPVSEFAAADPKIAATLIEHLREAPDAMSRAEAQAFMKDEGKRIEQEVGSALADNTAQTARAAAVETVRQVFEEQLNATGKFRPEVNRAYATMLGNFYATQAERAGVTVEEFMDRYQLRITKKDGGGQQRLEQGQFSQGEGGTTTTATAMRSELQARFGDIVDTLEERGVLKLWDGIDAFNQAGGQLSEDYRGAQGMFLQGTAHIFGDGVMPGNAIPVFLHEVGEHASMKAMLGKRYPVLVKRAYALAKQGDPIAVQALMRIPDNTPKKFMDSEMVAYLIEEAAGQENASEGVKAWLLEVIAAVKAFLFEKGVDIDLTPKEIAALAVRAVKFQARQEGRTAGGEVDIALSRAKDQTQTPEFRAWFGGSQVVDAQGRPLVVYHGTRADFDAFQYGDEIHFSTDPAKAGLYAEVEKGRGGEPRILPAYITVKNPKHLNDPPSGEDISNAKQQGHDGIVVGDDHWIAFRPEQIKSATGNRGTFDGTDPNILNQGEGTPRATLSFGNDITAVPSIIALLEGADLSSFLHEGGHLFLEIQADLAARIQRKAIGGMNDTSESEAQIVKDMNAILEWMGVNPADTGSRLDAWLLMSLEEKREHHESWARGFERYLMEGRAPSQELQGLFSKFRSWLISVYKALAGLNVDLTDEVRQVMDRMLATDEAIAEAQDARNMGPLFESPEKSGMTPAEYRDYQALGERQSAEAAAQVDAKLLKDMKWLSRARDKALKARQAEVDDLRREIRLEVTSDVMAQPVYQVWQFLTGKRPRGMEKSAAEVQYEQDAEAWKTKRAEAQAEVAKDIRAAMLAERPDLKKLERGQFLAKNKRQIDLQVQQSMLEWEQSYPKPQRPATSEEAVPPEFEVGRLNTDAVKAVDKGAASKLMERRMTSPEGMDPEIVADRFGFSSADHMIKALAAAPPPSQVIEEMVDQQMLERYGDVTSQEALDRAADEAVHNEVRARVVATELKALEKATTVRAGPRNTVDVMARAAKEYAYAAIAAIRVRDLRPSQYSAAAARSAKLAQQALGKSTEEAAMHKRNELINGYAAKAAYDAQEEVRALQKYMRKFDKRIDGIDPGYQDQIEQLLERFDFRPASLKAIDKRKSFAAWYAEQEAAGNAPSVPDELLDEASRKSYKDMTVEELRGLRDTVKQIEHQGRLKKKLLLARDARDFDAIATDMAASIIEHGGKAREVQLEGPNPVMDWFAGAWASHRKLASLFRQMDGNSDAGPMWEYIGRSMNEQSTVEDVALEQATMKLRELYAPLLKMRGGITGKRSSVYIPEINASLTRGGRLSVALNWGNEANRQRIMDGDKWSVDQVQAILKTLSPVELDFVNKVWEFIDSYWPQIAAKEKRLTGVEPEKVEAAPFNVLLPDGTEVAMRGGYYPLKYDTDRSDRADQHEAAQVAKEMMQGVFSKATTRRGHTKERLKEVKRAVRKDLNVITQHVTQVVHDLAYHEWLIDTNKLLADERVVSAIRDHYGPKVLKTMRDDVLGIATADVVPMDNVDKALLMLRGNVTRATMGASLTTAFLQPFGLTQSIVRIGGRHVLRGLARWGGDAARMESAIGWIHERSEFMRLRAKTFNRELREIRGSVQGKSATMRVVDAGLFVMMQKMQMVADVPTWLGQYEKSKSEGLSEDDAIAMADRAVVESQGGGNTKDMAEVQRKHPMLTQFYSYFSVTLNLAAEQTAATDFKNPAAVAGWLGDMALLMVIPAILPPMILYALRGGDDDDEKGMARRIVEWQVSYLLGTVVGLRELSGAVAGYDYAGPPVGRVIADMGKAGKQTAQGELDEPAVLAYINLMGTVFGIPVVQALRSYKGWKAWDEGQDGAGPMSVLLGPPPKD